MKYVVTTHGGKIKYGAFFATREEAEDMKEKLHNLFPSAQEWVVQEEGEDA